MVEPEQPAAEEQEQPAASEKPEQPAAPDPGQAETPARQVIKPLRNGPYQVRDLSKFTDSLEQPIETSSNMLLCRCGGSHSKPFCDNTHIQRRFNSAKISDLSLDRRVSYEGGKIIIHDNRAVCSHAGYCTSLLPNVFRRRGEPEIDPDAAPPEEIIEVIRQCPSGALSYSTGGQEHRDVEREPEIRLRLNGPYDVRGGIELAGEDFCEGASREHYQLCRCGASKNKPFCDGMHWHIDFQDGQRPGAGSAAGETNEEKSERKWHKAAGPDELADGEVKAVTVAGKALALTRVRGQYGALNGVCPHQGGPLGEGFIEKNILRCPWHGWGFDALTGVDIEGNHQPAATYPVEARDDGVYVEMEEITGGKPVATVSDLIVETMINWGVTHVFGMVGGTNLGLADAIRRRGEEGEITFIGIRHEGAAAFAASGFAKLTGRPAACLSIAGPGATNLLTGLWDCKADRHPVLALTGQVRAQYLGPGFFQEIDLAQAFQAVSAFSETVMSHSNHPELVTLALKHAVIERGVGHLIVPDEVQIQPATERERPSRSYGRIESELIAPPAESLDEATARIATAQRPVIVAGYGARFGMERLIALAERLGAPVITTLKAMGQIPYDHPLCAGVLGLSGNPVSSWAMANSDLLIAFGCSFSDHTGIDQSKTTIQVDFDRMSLGKFHSVAVPVWGDALVTAGLILDGLPGELAARDQREGLAERWRLWRLRVDAKEEEDRGRGINSAAIMRALMRQAPSDAVIAIDVGNNTSSFGRYFECRRQTVILSGYLGAIGFAFPAAMGTWAAEPGRKQIAVAGDGGFGQYLAEFTTAVKYGMDITLILINNSELGMISDEQGEGGFPAWETGLVNPDFAEYARSCGGFGVRVTKQSGLDEAMASALAYEGPAIVDIASDPELV